MRGKNKKQKHVRPTLVVISLCWERKEKKKVVLGKNTKITLFFFCLKDACFILFFFKKKLTKSPFFLNSFFSLNETCHYINQTPPNIFECRKDCSFHTHCYLITSD